MLPMPINLKRFVVLCAVSILIAICGTPSVADEQKQQENPSNPLAAVSNLDLRAKYFDLGDDFERRTYSLEGATMLARQDCYPWEKALPGFISAPCWGRGRWCYPFGAKTVTWR
jgi:hypothetical protein